MSRAHGAVEDVACQPRHDRGARPKGIHVVDGWREHQFHTGGTQQLDVVVERPRVGVEIFVLAELQRVHEDRDDDHHVADALGGVDQLQVTGMQRTHRRYQCHALTRATQRLTDSVQCGGVTMHRQFTSGVGVWTQRRGHRSPPTQLERPCITTSVGICSVFIHCSNTSRSGAGASVYAAARRARMRYASAIASVR